MTRRTARKGRRAGQEFWGCGNFPGCRGIVNIDHDETTITPAGNSVSDRTQPEAEGHAWTSAGRPSARVHWRDLSMNREGWIVDYVPCGGSLRNWSRELRQAAINDLDTAWMAWPWFVDAYQPADESTTRVLAMMRKIVLRGSLPPLAPDAESELLRRLGVEATDPIPGDLTPRTNPAIDAPEFRDGNRWRSAGDVDELQHDSTSEKDLLDSIASVRPLAVHDLIPQASLDGLLQAHGQETDGARRVDVLVQRARTVIELDGQEHHSTTTVDEERDAALNTAGYAVWRIPTSAGELSAAVLDSLPAQPAELDDYEKLAVYAPGMVHQLVLALIRAVEVGFLNGETWHVELHDPLDVISDLLPAYLDLMHAVEVLWGEQVCPGRLTVNVNGRNIAWSRQGASYRHVAAPATPMDPDVAIRLEPDLSPLHVLPTPDPRKPTIVVRGAALPVRVHVDTGAEPQRASVARGSADEQSFALRTILRAVFGKEDFRPGQLEALLEIIAGRDSVVLLPTGAGKSLIYQMAGLCMPGRTLVIDPIIALIEDQIEGLNSHGIDRTLGLSSQTQMSGNMDAAVRELTAGDPLYTFIAPERLQMRKFRDTLKTLTAKTPINVAVVDEAHCVSEWGHDFRTSYLRLGDVIRETCASPGVAESRVRPPILGLTGTASRAVLRDVLEQLDIDESTQNTLVRPDTFDRKELRYDLIRSGHDESLPILLGALGRLPGKFGVPQQAFFSGQTGASGIVFCPHVNGQFGVKSVAAKISDHLSIDAVFYSGKAPKGFDYRQWEATKRDNARRFMDDEVAVLVATKSFGMGIDKPNIRYVVHFGIPGSIEAYYQEVGRAGRDRRQAHCILVMSEFSEARAREILADNADIEAVRERNSATARNDNDDITRNLYFHLKSFHGQDTELVAVEEVLDLLDDIKIERSQAIPMGTSPEKRERALHRLVLLGVIAGYLVDWGGKKFEVTQGGASADNVADALARLIGRSQPGRLSSMQESLDEVRSLKLRPAVVAGCTMLIEFVYDTIERSRRRSLREMWLAAREADNEDAFRERILDYLSEGDVTPRLVEMAESGDLVITDWLSALLDITTVTEAREWRGAAGRLLASYPDHPGLLLLRGFTEIIELDGDLNEYAFNLRTALRSADQRYRVSEFDIEQLAGWLFDECKRRRRADALAVTIAVLRGSGFAQATVERAELNALTQSSPAPELAVVGLAGALDSANALISDVDEVIMRWMP